MSRLLNGIKNASYLAVGNFIAQVVSFVGFTFIARMLGPDDYGVYITVGAFVGMFDILLLGGLNKTIIREGSKDFSSMHLSLERTIGIRNLLFLVAIVVCIISSFLTPYEFQTKLYIMLFSFQLAYTGLGGFLGTIYQTTERMQYLSILGIANRTLSVSLSIIFLYCGFGLLALFLIALFSNLATTVMNYILSQRFVTFSFFSKIHLDKDMLKPALIFSLVDFVLGVTTRIDLLMISFLGAAKDVGIYAVAYKIALQGEILRNVNAMAFFPILVKRFHGGKVAGRKLIKYSLFFLGGIFVLSLTASYFVEDMITFLFGSEYKESGAILRILIFYLACSWATLPFTTAAQATHNEQYMLIVSSIMAGLNILLNYILFSQYGLIGIAYSTLVVSSVGGFLLCTTIYRIMKRQGYLL